jgi:hypothetical protein
MTAIYPGAIVGFALAQFHKTSELGLTTLTVAVTGSPSTFTTASATTVTPFPTDNYVGRFENELVFFTSRSSAVHTVGTRGAFGTSQVDHAIGTEMRVVAASAFFQQMAAEIVAMQGWHGFAASMMHASVTTTPYTATSADAFIPVDATSASATVNLPTAVGLTGRTYIIQKTDATANTVTVDASGSQTIGGSLTATLSMQNQGIIIWSDGANWKLASFGSGGSAGGGISWTEVTGTSATMAANNGYISNNAALVTLTLPTTAAVGSIIRVAGSGAGGWRIAQNASQKIVWTDGAVAAVDETTTGTGGRIDSTDDYDAVELLCITANNVYNIISPKGNPLLT